MSKRHSESYEIPGFAVRGEAMPWGTLLIAQGEMDIAAVPELRRLLDEAIGSRVERIILDLADVEFVDSIALATLVGAKRRLGAEGRLAVVVTRPYVLLVFEATGLNHVVTLVETREAAIAAVTA
jgi:anti-anti-sigma factor